MQFKKHNDGPDEPTAGEVDKWVETFPLRRSSSRRPSADAFAGLKPDSHRRTIRKDGA